jgi:hypothetical protein
MLFGRAAQTLMEIYSAPANGANEKQARKLNSVATAYRYICVWYWKLNSMIVV